MKSHMKQSEKPFLVVLLLFAVFFITLPLSAQQDATGESSGSFPGLGAVTHDVPTVPPARGGISPNTILQDKCDDNNGEVCVGLNAAAIQMVTGQELGSDVNGSLGVVHGLDKRKSEQTAGYGVFNWSLDKAEDKDGNYRSKSYKNWQGRIYSHGLDYTGNGTLIPTPRYGDGTDSERPLPVTYPSRESGVGDHGLPGHLVSDSHISEVTAADRLNPMRRHREGSHVETINIEEYAQLDDYVNERVRFTGIAGNYKAGAAVEIPGVGPIYIAGLESWPEHVYGKPVTVTGVLIRHGRVNYDEWDGVGMAQGITGPYYVIAYPSWHIESEQE